jgi:hypothetical protein
MKTQPKKKNNNFSISNSFFKLFLSRKSGNLKFLHFFFNLNPQIILFIGVYDDDKRKYKI